MKFAIACLLGMFLILGCIYVDEPPEVEHIIEGDVEIAEEAASVQDYMIFSEDGTAVSISAADASGHWQFLHEDYENEFLATGLHSDSFVRFNNTHLRSLSDGENIWLTLMINEKESPYNLTGVLFNAVYSQEILSCNSTVVNILGKNYVISTLKDGSSFEGDDKWKVKLEKENGCLKRVVIYLDGYFYDLRNQEQISLFRNDAALLFWFGSLHVPRIYAPPFAELVYNVPESTQIESLAGPDYSGSLGSGQAIDQDAARAYDIAEVETGEGLLIEFQPAIPSLTTNGWITDEVNSYSYGEWQDIVYDYGAEDYFSDVHNVEMNIYGNEFRLLKLRKNSSGIDVILGRLESHKILRIYEDAITVGDEELGFFDINYLGEGQALITLGPIDNDRSERTNISAFKIEEYSNHHLKVWSYWQGCYFGTGWIDISSFSYLLDLSDPQNNITLEFGDEDTWNPSLKSIFIPRSSPFFEKLTNASDLKP